MQNQDTEILTRAHEWLTANHRVVLITVANTWGSSPRPPGSLMALREDGHVIGSVSGGCIEDDLITRIQATPFQTSSPPPLTQGEATTSPPYGKFPEQPQIVHYGVDADEARRFGLPCGGSMRLVLEPLSRPDALSELISQLQQGQQIVRRLDLKTGQTDLKPATGEQLTLDDKQFTRVFGPGYRLLIIGAGQIASLLARIALSLDFAVTICDPRTEYSTEWSIPGTTLVATMPDDTVLDIQPDANLAVVALTHDPKLDDLALMEALASPAFYIAALGSQSNNDQRRERLREFDLSTAQIARLHGPAGLTIGSRTPAEIAVSIAAQLVAAKNNRMDS